MLENIALIKEVHELLATKLAQKEASEYLERIELKSIGLNRLTQCSSIEIFYILIIRALMTKEMLVIIVAPFHLVDNLRDMESILTNIQKLNNKKDIIILDTISNETHYKGRSCNIVK